MSLSWHGMVQFGDPNTPPFAIYSIDGSSSILFKVTPDLNIRSFFQLFFTTPELSPTEHSLLMGTNSSLGLMYFYVTNVIIPSSGSIGFPSSGIPPNSSSGPTLGSASPVMGRVFSGIFLVALIVFFPY